MSISKKTAFSIITFFIITSISLSAAEIGSIKFKQKGNMKVPEDLLRYNLSQQSGTKFSQNLLNDDIKRLYDTGYFSDVEATTEKTKSGKINITFNVITTPRINVIRIKGNDKISTGELLKHIELHSGEPLDSKKLRQSVENIRQYYHENGYYRATVMPSTKKLKDGEIDLTFKISENLRLKINSVNFTGNKVFSSWNLKHSITTKHSYLNWVLDWGLYNKDNIKKDKLILRNLYWTKGYLDFSVKVKTRQLKDDPEYIDVNFDIHEGQPYTVSRIVIHGEKLFTENEIRKMITLKKGEVYDIRKEEESIKAIKYKYQRYGYCDFSLNTNLDSDYKTHKVDLIFNLNEGTPYTIRDVNISGNHITKDYVIRRELPLQPGEPVDKIRIDAGKSRLMAMNYFKKVKSYTSNSNIPGEKNVNYEVKEKGTAHVALGAGYSTTNSLVGRLTLSESNFDLLDPSSYFRGGGQRVNLLAQVGLERNDFALSFTEPWLFGIPLRLQTTGFWHTREFINQWHERHGGFEVGLDKPVGEFNTVGVKYAIDFVKVHDMDSSYTQAEKDKYEGNSRRGQLSINFKRDTRDNLIMPTSGYLLSALGEVNSEIIGASANYYRLQGEADGYYSLFDEFLILHGGLQYGIIQNIIGNDDVPIYQKYFLGGQNSLRGFKYRRVSPLNQNGAQLGGNSMAAATFEAVHPIYKWIKGAPFVDVGNVWENSWNIDFNLNVGVGYGLRIILPQLNNTPIRIDFGYPVYRTDSQFNDSLQFYIDVGFNW
ncbi:MAG: outer membrane protein assembly factor BamA [Victivallales bacterium]|nr:outer membrane protein assembly factor BamA [Victivallales bacterium]